MPSGPENPYPISDQNVRFSIPYFRPDCQKVYLYQSLWGTVITATLNRIDIDTERDTVTPNRMCVFPPCNVRGGASLVNSHPKPSRRNIYHISERKGTFSTLFQTLNARKWYPLGGMYVYGLYMNVCVCVWGGGGGGMLWERWQSHSFTVSLIVDTYCHNSELGILSFSFVWRFQSASRK